MIRKANIVKLQLKNIKMSKTHYLTKYGTLYVVKLKMDQMCFIDQIISYMKLLACSILGLKSRNVSGLP
jgi:hypothetical protein